MPHRCSNCGSPTTEFARGGGPANCLCSDCALTSGSPSPYTIGPPENPYAPEGAADEDSGVEVDL